MSDREKLNSPTDAVKSIEDFLFDAVESKKWMAAVWKIQDGKIVLVGRTTWDFPTADMMQAVDDLRDDCQGELNESPMAGFGTKLHRACNGVGPRVFGVVDTEKIEKPQPPENRDTTEGKALCGKDFPNE